MTQDNATNLTPGLAGVALHYPEKTFYLGQVFRHTTNSYKLFWFLAILSLMKRSKERSLPLADIFAEMAAAAWHPVCLYRLSLGRQDKLQDVIKEIQQNSDLRPNTTPESIRKFVAYSEETKEKVEFFKRFVPTRFLTPWFAEKLRGNRDDAARTREIQTMASESQKTLFATPYYFERDLIRLNESWRSFFMENLGVVQSFAEHHLALYLQARNPNVPGVVNKLRAPTERQLNEARQFWKFIRIELGKLDRLNLFRDIYSEKPLAQKFSIDHFLPWSFVVHDLFWNLTPVEQATNSAKNDTLPDLDLYLPRLAELHSAAIEVAKTRPKLLEDYTDCFRMDVGKLLCLNASGGLVEKFREVIVPQAQIAANQGFRSGWRMPAPAIATLMQRHSMHDEVPDRVAPTAVAEVISRRVIIEFFPRDNLPKSPGDYLPFYSLAIAAGGFLAGDAVEPEGWVEASKHGFSKRLTEGMFVTRVVRESMEPTIRNGSYCVFRSPVVGTRQGRVVLVQKRIMTDPETGGNYTVKRYQSIKSIGDESWHHESIRLIPDNPDREKFPILAFSVEDNADLRVVAEFIQMLSPSM